MDYSDDLKYILSKKKINTRYEVKYNYILPEIIMYTSFLANDAPFLQRIWHLKYKYLSPLKCANSACINLLQWHYQHGYSGRTYCSKQCARNCHIQQQKIKNTCIEKYGVEFATQSIEFKKRRKDTLYEKYGVENIWEVDEVKQKRISSLKQKYGVESPLQNTEINRKRKQTNNTKYGNENCFLVPQFIDKSKNTNFVRYGNVIATKTDIVKQRMTEANLHYSSYHTIWPDDTLSKLKNKDFLYTEHYINKKSLLEIAYDLKSSSSTVADYLHKHGLYTQNVQASESLGEKNLKIFISLFNIEIKSNIRSIISPYELDIYIPSHNLAIEYCGLYWHNELHINNNYHKTKYDLCKENGIRLITIFEDEWQNNQEMVQKKLMNILGLSNQPRIFARKTIIQQVSRQEKTTFFNSNHIQGDGPSSINIGLYYNNELLACIGFIKCSESIYNLSRYATSKTVVGGFSKLLKYFESTYNPSKITTFADLRWSEGDLYYKNGFTMDKELSPDYNYIVGKNRQHKFNFRHKQLAKKLENYDPNLSEHQNCLNHNIYKIYDCGKLRFQKTINN